MDEQKMSDPCIHCKRVVKFSEDNLDCPLKCEGCGFLPWTRVSQQPHGKSTLFCNMCQMYVVPTSFGGETDICPYHQRISHSEDGETEFMYDEFNQDGEEW